MKRQQLLAKKYHGGLSSVIAMVTSCPLLREVFIISASFCFALQGYKEKLKQQIIENENAHRAQSTVFLATPICCA